MSESNQPQYRIHLCDGPSCGITHESDRLADQLRAAIAADPSLRERVEVCAYTCFGRCDDGPNMFVRSVGPGEDPDDEPDTAVFDTQRGFYPGMNEDRVLRVLQEHCGRGRVVDDLVDDY